MASSGPRQTLLLFCKFLTHRVRTEHVDLLYTIALEFLESPPCFTRVDEMLYRVFPLVAILPIELVDESVRAKADRVLERMRRCSSDDECEGAPDNVLRDLGIALHGRISLKNWDLLERVYNEFKMGSDRALRAFVSLQPQAIAILPVPPGEHIKQDEVGSTASPTGLLETSTASDPEATSSSQRVRDRCGVQAQELHFRRFDKAVDPKILDIVRAIRTELDAIEADSPWDRVFNLSTISNPFDESKYPTLACQFRTFWTRYARCVWQRHFWCRVPNGDQDDAYIAKQALDKAASKHFAESVMLSIFRTFGARFFLELDAQPERLHWWWYRGPLVDLVRMASVEGLDYCLRYLRSQKLKRFPTPHPQFLMKTSFRNTPSPSMWSTHSAAKPILDAIVRLQKNPNPRIRSTRKATKSRKRPRAPPSSSEEDDSE